MHVVNLEEGKPYSLHEKHELGIEPFSHGKISLMEVIQIKYKLSNYFVMINSNALYFSLINLFSL